MRWAPVLVCLPLIACTAHAPAPEAAATPSPVTPTASADLRPPSARQLLERPLDLPPLLPGEPCPTTRVGQQPDAALGFIQGRGDVGPVGLSHAGLLGYFRPPKGGVATDRSWGMQKVLWAVHGDVVGPVLVRGHQLDGPHEVRFNDPPERWLLLEPQQDASPGGWRDYPGYTRLIAPGCYGYQIDGPTGTTVVIFRAEGPDLSAEPATTASQ
jgi:hypothetical protein